MSGFSAEWLALRAPVDTAARDGGLLRAAAALAPRRVMDIGCGTGAMLATLHPLLAQPAAWVLVDGDARLLTEAAARAASLGVDAQTLACDLLETPLPVGAIDLVTATALFDLVSAPWLDRFLAALAARRLPLYAALSYDGAMAWAPPHPLDGAVTAAFNRHQRRDKGFGGPALGPDAPAALAAGLTARGYHVTLADSPWQVGPEHADFTTALLAGIAAAVAEEASVPASADWLAARQADTRHMRVGHVDLLAVPL